MDIKAKGKISSNEFSAFVCQQLGWYVYALIDPRDNSIFYIGKGKGNRAFQHLKEKPKNAKARSTQKITRIEEIANSGLQTEIMIVRHGISSEKSAFEIESALIDFANLLDGSHKLDNLTNLVLGHGSKSIGAMKSDVVISLYEAPKCQPIDFKCILFRIPKRWTPTMTAAELFESTHGWWVLGERREKADYAVAVSNGVIREIYKIDSWRQRRRGDRDWTPNSKPRWGFFGSVAADKAHFKNKSVKHLFKVGDQKPKYVNC